MFLVLTICNVGASLTFESIFHLSFNVFYFDCDITLESACIAILKTSRIGYINTNSKSDDTVPTIPTVFGMINNTSPT